MKKCCVIGSVNMDMVTRTDKFPKPGETRKGISFQTIPGGKGANQAVALSRLGVPTYMAGRVGDDLYGRMYLDHFQKTGTHVEALGSDPAAGTGIAAIEVDDAGENHIIVVPGANDTCTPAWLNEIFPLIADCDIFLLQLEIPLETVQAAVDKLYALHKIVILDPAPARALSRELLSKVSIVTPNATELVTITGDLPESADIQERANHLLQMGVSCVVHKSGANGAYIATRDGWNHVPSFKVKAVDSTAAGDTFNGGLAAGLSMGWGLDKAVVLANAAAALSVTKLGAQTGMPTMEEAQSLMEQFGA
jgi:ribokinase